MLKVGGGNIYNCAHSVREKFCDPANFPLKPRPFIVIWLGDGWQEFVDCARLETGSKSTRTDFVATCP